MKKIKILIAVLVTCISIVGCVVNGTQVFLSGNPKDAVFADKESFIELNDGTIVEGKIKGDRISSYAVINRKRAAEMDNKSYPFDSYSALQQNGKYFRKFKNRLVERIVKGNINVYRQEFTGGAGVTGGSTVTSYGFYLQKGLKEALVDFDLKTLRNMVSDYAPAISLMDEYATLDKKQKRKEGDYYLNRVIAKYNDK